MHQKQLFKMIYEYLEKELNGYIQKDELLNDMENYIVAPGLQDNAGICGALALAKLALEK